MSAKNPTFRPAAPARTGSPQGQAIIRQRAPEKDNAVGGAID